MNRQEEKAMEKEWKDRPASIAEFEMLWDVNKNLEIAKALILSLKDIEGLSFQEKLEFLLPISDSAFHKPILEVILDLVPECTKYNKDYHVEILKHIKDSMTMDIKNCMGRIKKFVHSVLNTYGKENNEDTFLYGRTPTLICQVLIQCGMFEELINYNFTDISSIVKLWDHVFVKDADSNTLAFQYSIIFEWPENCYGGLSHLGPRDVSTISRKNKQKISELLCSWDKIENRHALATLWTLLAKRGDLEKIFGAEKAEEIKKVE